MSDISVPEGSVYSRSVVQHEGTTYFLIGLADGGQKQLGVTGNTQGFTGKESTQAGTLLCPLTPENAAALRARLPWLTPVPLGKQTSFGFGDRLGLATPGHIQALRATDKNQTIHPIFAQQSVRENTRIGRTPQEVMDAALWGIFEEGWHESWGADADHVKELSHLPMFVNAGYTFYTLDPSDHVDNDVHGSTVEALRTKSDHLPWDVLQTTYTDIQHLYCDQPFAIEGLALVFDEQILLQALVKYGRAIAHTVTIANALKTQLAGKPFDLEMSVDETDTPTSIHEHFYIANELKRLGVAVVSVAPRFVGKFQKGVDYIGDLDEFEKEFAKHAAIMNHFDTYKLSIHTGSDKFSIYPIIAKHVHGQVHVKTAGTSYLEALRIIAQYDPPFFRRILTLSRERFEHDRKSYFLDAQLDRVPAEEALSDSDLPKLLDQFDARQVLHVAFGSVLDEFKDEFYSFILTHTAEYEAGLIKHFQRHLQPFSA